MMGTQVQYYACAEMAKQMLVTGPGISPPYKFNTVYLATRLAARALWRFTGGYTETKQAEIDAIAQGGMKILMQEFAKDWLDNETMVKLMNEFAQEQLKQQAGR